MEHEENHVGEGQSVNCHVIDASHDSNQDHLYQDSCDQDKNGTHLVDCEAVQNGDQKILWINSSLIATWVLLFSIELLSPPMDLIRCHAGEKCHFFLSLILVAVVAGAPDDTDEVSGKAGKGLFIEDAPILILVCEVGSGQVILDDNKEGYETCCSPQENSHHPKLLPILIVGFGQEGQHDKELHITCEIPCPVHTVVSLAPRDQIVQEGHVPDPVLLALVHVLVLEEKGALATEKRHEAPEKEKCEDVQWPQSDEATED